MQEIKNQPLILTLKFDEKSQVFFDKQRKLYFPPERNFLDAHLTLFHQLPDDPKTYDSIRNLQQSPFEFQAIGLMNLGAGVAYKIDNAELNALHKKLSEMFKDFLIPQDWQAFRPHITVMNKSTSEKARQLLAELSVGFQPFMIKATGLDVWTYLGGPWRHEQHIEFNT